MLALFVVSVLFLFSLLFVPFAVRLYAFERNVFVAVSSTFRVAESITTP